MKRICKIFSLVVLSFGFFFSSCAKLEPGEVLEAKNHFQTINDANNSVLALYGKFMELAGPVVVLNELRADLMDITTNATQDLQEISMNTPSKGNKWTTVTPFYTVIQNCNDILYNFNIMKKESKLTENDYKELYSDVLAIRCWTYLQLGIQFGRVPYVTEPIVNISEIATKTQLKLDLDPLLDSLINCMVNAPSLEPYVHSELIQDYLDGHSLVPYFINKKCLLGDLYLYRDRYLEAATMYRDVLATNEENSDARTYRLFSWVTGTTVSLGFQIAYTRYKEDDVSSFINTYNTMYSESADNPLVRQEMIWEMTYDDKYAPIYPFIELFANEGIGKYLLKPSQFAIDSLWDNQMQTNNFGFDGRGETSAFNYIGGQPVVQKYLYNYNAALPYQQTGKWFLYRAGLLHIRFAEAANRCKYPDLALALLNNGIGAYYNWTTYPGTNISVRLDSTRISGKGPGNYYPQPFYFDARQSDQPYVRAPWRNGSGIRGRVSLRPITIPPSVVTLEDSIQFMENAIVTEAALEYGLEGQRWGDLVRISRRKNKDISGTGDAFLKNTINRKYEKSGLTPPVYGDESTWFLPANFD